jgi:hypothetical protein
MERRVPKNLIRTGDAETLGMDGKARSLPQICGENQVFLENISGQIKPNRSLTSKPHEGILGA